MRLPGWAWHCPYLYNMRQLLLITPLLLLYGCAAPTFTPTLISTPDISTDVNLPTLSSSVPNTPEYVTQTPLSTVTNTQAPTPTPTSQLPIATVTARQDTPTPIPPIEVTPLGGPLAFCDGQVTGPSWAACGYYIPYNDQNVRGCANIVCSLVPGGLAAGVAVDVYCLYVQNDLHSDVWANAEPGCIGNDWFAVQYGGVCYGVFYANNREVILC